VEEIREQILAGDYRALYLGWLVGVSPEYAEIDEDEEEPPVPPGLGKLGRPLQTMCRVFGIDEDLLQAAAKASGKSQLLASEGALEKWIAALPSKEKDRLLVEACEGNAQQVAGGLMGGFRKSQRTRQPRAGKGRTVKQLRDLAKGR
jgi:hypothetical protein